MLQDKCVTPSKLSETYVTNSKLDEKLDEMFASYDVKIDTKLDDTYMLGRSVSATCYTQSSVRNKQIIVSIVRVGDKKQYSKSHFDGWSFFIKFQNTHSSPDAPLLSLLDSDGIELVNMQRIPIVVNGEPASGKFIWKAGDIITLVYNAKLNVFEYADTNSLRILANWCADNNATVINGAMIATGTISAQQIKSGSITADKIAVGGLDATKFEKSVLDVFNNVYRAATQVNRAKTIVIDCDSDESSAVKTLILDEAQASSILTKGKIRVGASLLVRFKNRNLATSDAKIELKTPNGSTITAPIGTYKINDNKEQYTSTDITELNWDINGDDGDAEYNRFRLFTYDGNFWVIYLPTSSTKKIAEWCRENGQVWIDGGSIIAGKIACTELEAGTINSDYINLGLNYFSNLSSTKNWPVLCGITSGVGSVKQGLDYIQTQGIKMYSKISETDISVSSIREDTKCNYFIATETGLSLNTYALSGKSGNISMWGDTVSINAKLSKYDPTDDELNSLKSGSWYGVKKTPNGGSPYYEVRIKP